MYEFDEAIAVDQDSGTVAFPERWTMGPGFAHGGYLMSVALAGARALTTHPDPITMSAHFVRPGKVGSASLHRELLKAGRSLSTVRSDIVQEGSVAVATLTTFGDLTSAGDIGYRSVSMPLLPPPQDCLATDPGANQLVPTMVRNLDLRLTPASTAWTQGRTLDAARMEGWVSFADGRPIDTLSLPMFADALPPPVFSVGSFAPWTPTIELTLHVRRRPATQRLAVSFHTDLIGGMFFESSGTLWNEDGSLVAMSRQIQLINR
ncbi:MAG: thioesterase family protein [Acidimicrobiia bacterium]